MKIKLKGIHLYLLLILIHIGVSFYAFEPFISDPQKVSFDNVSDGLKNYFTLYTYVNDPVGKDDIFKYNRMAYPYGDYVYSTDNTPGFSIPFRWYCCNVRDVSTDVLVFFNWYIILHIIVTGPMVFYLFRNTVRSNLFAFMMAVVLPWMNIQLPRIWHGHFNLSFFSLTVGAACLLVAWHKNRARNGRLWLIALLMTMLSFFAFMQHGYYIAIISIFIGGFLLTYGLMNRREWVGRLSVVMSVLVPAVILGLALLLLQMTDGYIHLRPERAEGYDYHEMKTRFYSLFSAYDFHTFFFPVRTVHDATHEHAAYLGNISLYATAIIGLLAVYKKEFRLRIKIIQQDFFKNKFNLALVVSAMLMLFISFGEAYYTGPDGYFIYNFLNPFFWVHQLTDYVEQFRALARFNWPFFLVFNVWAVYTIYALYLQYDKKVKRIVVLLFILLGYVEVKDFVETMRDRANRENMLETTSIKQQFSPLSIDYSKYQAILPVPFFHVGCEDYRYTIDDYTLWTQFVFRLSLHSDLPLMSSRLSRTPPVYAKAMLDLVARDILDTSLQRLLNDKPVLVVTNKTYVAMNILPPGNDTAKVYYRQAAKFVEAHNLQPIDSMNGDLFFYEWYPKRR